MVSGAFVYFPSRNIIINDLRNYPFKNFENKAGSLEAKIIEQIAEMFASAAVASSSIYSEIIRRLREFELSERKIESMAEDLTPAFQDCAEGKLSYEKPSSIMRGLFG